MFRTSDYGRSSPSVGRGTPPANPNGTITLNIPTAEDLGNLIGSVLVLFPMLQEYIDALGATVNPTTNAASAAPSVYAAPSAYALQSGDAPATGGGSRAVDMIRTLAAMVRERSNVVVGANELSAVLEWLDRQRNPPRPNTAPPPSM